MWPSSSSKKSSNSKGRRSMHSEWSEWQTDQYGRVYKNRKKSDGTWEYKFAESEEQPRSVPQGNSEEIASLSRGEPFNEDDGNDQEYQGNKHHFEELVVDEDENENEDESYAIDNRDVENIRDPLYGYREQAPNMDSVTSSFSQASLSPRPPIVHSHTSPPIAPPQYSFTPAESSISFSSSGVPSMYSASDRSSRTSSFSEGTSGSGDWQGGLSNVSDDSYASSPYDQNASVHVRTTPGHYYTSQNPSTAPAAQEYEEYEESSTATNGRYITTSDSTIGADLDKKFKVCPSKTFIFGKVFKILWTEPKGENARKPRFTDGGEIETKYGEKAYASIRRFIVISSQSGHSLCVPILTYENKATTKKGVKPQDHAIVYIEEKSRNWNRPKETEGEERLRKKPIRIDPETPRDKLSPKSRINYAKIYTVEHNVKVQFIGKVHSKSLPYFKRDYNNTHLPLPLDPNDKYSDEEGGVPSYNLREQDEPINPANKHFGY